MRVRDFRDPISDIRLPERSLFSMPSKVKQIKILVSEDKNSYATTNTRLDLPNSISFIKSPFGHLLPNHEHSDSLLSQRADGGGQSL